MNRNAKIGLFLFFVYLAFYSVFVGLNAFSPETMAQTPFPGINLATVYGFALILLALLLSLVYGALCYICGDRQGNAS